MPPSPEASGVCSSSVGLSRPRPALRTTICVRRAVSDREILERCLYPMISEGAQILDEGKAQRASDIDVVWANGYGFPIGKGGPMFWAGLEGGGRIVQRLDHWHERTGRPVFEAATAAATILTFLTATTPVMALKLFTSFSRM